MVFPIRFKLNDFLLAFSGRFTYIRCISNWFEIMKIRYAATCILLTAISFGRATILPGKADTLTIEKALSRYNIGAPVISPDGSKAIVPVTQVGTGADLPATHLWLLDIATQSLRQFTSSAKSESAPKWSPDSKQLAFLSARGGMPQIYLINMDGGEALALTKSKTAISRFEWNPDGKTIAYITEDALTDSIKKRQDDKFDERVMSDESKPSRLYTIDVATKKIKQLAKGKNWDIGEMSWMPSGNELMLVVTELPSPELQTLKLIKYSLADSAATILAAPNHGFWGDVLVSPDGKTLVFESARTDGPVNHDLFVHQLAENKYRNISEKKLDRSAVHFKFTDNNTLLALVQQGFNTNLYTIKDDGAATPYPLKDNVLNFDVAANGTLVYIKGDFNHLPELYLAKPGQQPVKVSDFNNSFAQIALIAPQMITYKSFDGKQIEGALFKPANSSSKLLPLVVYIHGGPTGAFSNSYSAWVQLIVQKGYAVFCPNIRGSTGYGWDFIVSNRKDWGGADYKDVMAGVDYLIAHEGINPDKLGISGWSYGGYMAEWAITQTHRFKASVSGAGLSNLASEFGTENGVDYDHWFWGKPYENLPLFYKFSPVAYLKNAITPTLIIQGENDTTDPIGQSQELYRGLRFYNVPTELVVYPREPHGFREINHNIDFYRRMLLWFDKYM